MFLNIWEICSILRIQFTVPTKLFALKTFRTISAQTIHRSLFKSKNLTEQLWESTQVWVVTYVLKTYSPLIIEKSTKCWFWYSWIMKNHNRFTILGTPFRPQNGSEPIEKYIYGLRIMYSDDCCLFYTDHYNLKTAQNTNT